MSRNVLLRCAHCGVKYSHYVSGWQVSGQQSSGDYCATCHSALEEAKRRTLAALPIQCKEEWIPSTAFTAAQLHALRIERDRQAAEKAKASGQLFPLTKVYAVLFDLADPTNTNQQGELVVDGYRYRYSCWKKTKTEDTVKIRGFRNVITGQWEAESEGG